MTKRIRRTPAQLKKAKKAIRKLMKKHGHLTCNEIINSKPGQKHDLKATLNDRNLIKNTLLAMPGVYSEKRGRELHFIQGIQEGPVDVDKPAENISEEIPSTEETTDGDPPQGILEPTEIEVGDEILPVEEDTDTPEKPLPAPLEKVYSVPIRVVVQQHEDPDFLPSLDSLAAYASQLEEFASSLNDQVKKLSGMVRKLRDDARGK